MSNQKQTVSSGFTSQILASPEVKNIVRSQLDSRIAELKTELDQLTTERAQVDEGVAAPEPKKLGRPAVKKTVSAENGTGRKPGRPTGSQANHGPAILEVLAKRPGLGLTEIHKALTDKKHACDKKTVATYLSTMSSKGLLKAEGDRPNTKYFPAE